MDSFDIGNFIRPHLLMSHTYEAMDPPKVLAKISGINEGNIIKLNGNENPYGASPKAIEALKNITLHIYPDPNQVQVRQALSKYTGITVDHLVAGAGADEIIDLLFRIFISPGDKILDCAPTFGMYSFCAKIAGADVTYVDRDANYDINVDNIISKIDAKTKIIFITSPNNPTGNTVSTEQIKRLISTNLLIVIDEAYYEFSQQTVQDLVPENKNLIVLRTMSKWAGLAGLRIGYGIMHPSVANYLMEIKPPYNINSAAEAALLASFEDIKYLNKNVLKIISERERMFILLNQIPKMKVYPSRGNYILCEFSENYCKRVYAGLIEKGIFVRKYTSNRLENSFRISIGTPEQNDYVTKTIKTIMNKNE